MRLLLMAAIAATGTLTGCTTVDQDVDTLATARMISANGSYVGQAVLTEDNDQLSLSVDLNGLAAGEHAFHLHTTGRCDAPDFTTAGGHLNPAGKAHGKLNPQGSHLGDLPNVTVGSDGTLATTIVIQTDASADTLSAIFDTDGTAIMLHDGADDYVSDPAGAAGPRIACGVLTRT